MSTQSFDLPVDVPWQLIAASPDMMDTEFCNGHFPPPWRSSLAIYAYEPSPDDLPAEMCNQKITYLKVTCSITGYQPDFAETFALAFSGGNYPFSPYSNPTPVNATFPDAPGKPVDDTLAPFGDFADAYLACYGVLLNVAVFPSTTTVPSSTTTVVTLSFDTDAVFPNPLSKDGLTFTLTPSTANLPVQRAPDKSFALLISNASLEIDFPLCKNVTLALAVVPAARAPKQANIGTITAYLGNQIVFTTALPLTKGFEQIAIAASGYVTKVVIQSNVHTYLSSVSYSNSERATTLGDYPHIIDFEPKTRDLYQTATDQNELLTGSNSAVGTGKSMSNTSSSEMGLSLTGGYGSGTSGGPNASGQVTGKWGNTSTDTSTLQIDNSRERRETQGSTTNITQQYNLLTGYHAGTNRAAFIMLPRPHTLQATDYRTFVRGLRMIEGMQDFFLIVSRPKILPGICIEASLETGHFPENVTTAPPPVVTTKQFFPFSQDAHAKGGFTTSAVQTPFAFTLPDPWIVDTTVTTPPPTFTYSGVPGIFYFAKPVPGQNTSSSSWSQADNTLSIGISQSDGSSVTGNISISAAGATGGETNADIEILFLIAAVQTQPAPTPVDQEQVVVSDFLITSRELCVCLNSCVNNDCVEVVPPKQVPFSQSPGLNLVVPDPLGALAAENLRRELLVKAPNPSSNAPSPAQAGLNQVALSGAAKPPAPESGPGALSAATNLTAANLPSGASTMGSPGSIVYEAKLKVPRRVLAPEQLQKSRTPAARELMRHIQFHLMNSWRMPQRRAHGTVGFLESDYLANRIRRRLPREYLARRVSSVEGLPPAVIKALGPQTTIGDVLKHDLHRLQHLAKVSTVEAGRIRRRLFGLAEDTTPANDAAKLPETHRTGGTKRHPRNRRRQP